jgi:hypothetical protein
MTRIRRSKAEMAAGMTVEDKRAGLTMDTFKASNKEAEKKPLSTSAKKATKEYADTGIKLIFEERIVEKEIPVIKEVRILNSTEGTEKTVQEIMNLELRKCTWEWMQLPIKDFTVAQLKKLGKEGWHMAFTHNPKDHIPSSTKGEQLCFQRPRYQKKSKK